MRSPTFSLIAVAFMLTAVDGCASSDNTLSDAGPDGGGDGGTGLNDSGVVTPGAPVIASFTASPTMLSAAGSTLLSWSVTDADTLSIDNGVGDVTGTTSKSVNVSATTTFTLTAANAKGTVTKQAVVTLTISGPVIGSFTATPGTLNGSGPVLLEWTTTDATSLSIDNGVGDVTGKTSKTVTVVADTAFTLTATGPGGSTTHQAQVTVVPEIYVDPATGADTNPGTQAAPLKTLTKAVAIAQSGDTIHLNDGIYDAVNEGCATNDACQGFAIPIPNGVTLRAVSPQAAKISYLSLNVAKGSATLIDLTIDGDFTGIFGTTPTGGSSLTLTGIAFTNHGHLAVAGALQAVMTPGSLTGAYTTQPPGIGFAAVAGTATLAIHGGSFDCGGAGQGAFGGGFFTVNGNAQLTLDGVTLKNWNASAISAVSGAPVNQASVTLVGGTVIDNAGGVGNCAANGAVVLAGTPTLTMDNAQIINSKNTAICIRNGSVLGVAIRNGSQLTGNATGIGSEPGGAGSQLTLAIAASALNSNQGVAIDWPLDGSFDLNTSTFDLNGAGVHAYGNVLTVKARTSTFNNNNSYGVLLQGSTVLNLGTAADPGQNSFVGNLNTGLSVAPATPTSVSARGNSWNPNVQGADATGKYPPNTTVGGPINVGTNYQIAGTSTLDL